MLGVFGKKNPMMSMSFAQKTKKLVQFYSQTESIIVYTVVCFNTRA